MKIAAMSLIVSGVLDTRNVRTGSGTEAVRLNTTGTKNILHNARSSRKSQRRLYHLLSDLMQLSASAKSVLKKAFGSLAIPGEREIDSLTRQQVRIAGATAEQPIDGGFESSTANLSSVRLSDSGIE